MLSEQQGDHAVARNFLISSAAPELRRLSDDPIAGKKIGPLERDRTLLKQMTDTVTLVNVSLERNIYLDAAAAFNLDQPPMNRFFDRVARALLHEETKSGFVAYTIKWKPVMDLRLNKGISRYATRLRSVGDIFSYAGQKREVRLFGIGF